MTAISVQKIPKPQATLEDLEDLLARFCYKFPQYTYAQAKQLPNRRINRMLASARREDARRMIELVNVVSAPHSKNGIKNVIQSFQDIINGEDK